MLEHKSKEEKIRKTNRKQKSPVKKHSNELILLKTQIQEEISSIERLKDALLKTKSYLENILVHSFDLVLKINRDGTIGYVNNRFYSETGYSHNAIQGRHIIEIISDNFKELILAKLHKIDKKASEIFEVQLIKANGTLMDCLVSLSPLKEYSEFLFILKNITHVKKIEHKLIEIQKLESIDILAKGIAHDFNNALTAILGNISLAQMYFMEKEVHNHLIEIEKASFWAKNLTQQLLAISKRDDTIKQWTSLAELLQNSIIFALKGSKVKCEFFISSDLWPIEVDKKQISQAINNFIMESYRNMPHGGTIYVQADNITLSSENMLALKAGDYIKISIKNHETRILREQLQGLYDTKKQDDWNPSLAWSCSVVKNHHGHIIKETKTGFGITFSIYLPASPERVKGKKKEKTFVPGHGRVLVMDDEDMVRHITGKMLYQLGYEAEFVENGDDAIKVYKQAMKSRESFDAVIIDLTIPGGLGGKETIQKLLIVDPRVKAIVASGYQHDPVMSRYNEFGFCGVITKPFTIEELSMELQRIIANK